jgi:hypothetical protein
MVLLPQQHKQSVRLYVCMFVSMYLTNLLPVRPPTRLAACPFKHLCPAAPLGSIAEEFQDLAAFVVDDADRELLRDTTKRNRDKDNTAAAAAAAAAAAESSNKAGECRCVTVIDQNRLSTSCNDCC